MKLSAETIELINNFKLLNPGLVFKKGSVIKTVSSRGSMPIAIARIKEEFPADFAISDLHRFLTVFHLLNDPDLEFKDSEIVMTDESNKKAVIRYASESLIKHMDYSKTIRVPSEDVKFRLTQNNFKSIKKAADFFLSPEIAILSENGKIKLTTYNTNDPGGDKFSIDLDLETDSEFLIIIQTDFLTILPRDYDVTISFKGLVEFKGSIEENEVMYYISISEKSKVY